MMQFRDPMQIPARLSQALFLSLLVGFLYLQVRFWLVLWSRLGCGLKSNNPF
jgi:hypothetical protein